MTASNGYSISTVHSFLGILDNMHSVYPEFPFDTDGVVVQKPPTSVIDFDRSTKDLQLRTDLGHSVWSGQK